VGGFPGIFEKNGLKNKRHYWFLLLFNSIFAKVLTFIQLNFRQYSDFGNFHTFLVLFTYYIFVFGLTLWKSRSSSTTGESAGTLKANRKNDL